MTSVMPGRRRAEEFAALVDGRTLRTPSRDAALLALVEDLRTTSGPDPRPEYVASLRARLMAEADAALAAGTDTRLLLPTRTRRDRRVAVAAGAMALVGATSSVAIAAQDALPGDALYPVKRALESAETSLQADTTQRAEKMLSNAYGRLAEASALARMENAASLAALPETLDDFTVQADQGADLALAEYAETGDEAVVEGLQDFVANSMDALVALEDQVPVSARDSLDEAARVLADIDARARAACPTCGGSVLEIPESFLTSFGAAVPGAPVSPSRVVLAPNSSQDRTRQGGRGDTDGPFAPGSDEQVDFAAPDLDVEGTEGGGDEPKDEPKGSTSSPLQDLADVLIRTDRKGSESTSTGSGLDPLLQPLEDTVGDAGDLLDP